MKLALALVSTLLVGTPNLVVGQSSATPPRAPCQIAQDWVQQHPNVIHANLGEFALFPGNYRKAGYATMTTPERISLWREHFAVYTGPASRLSAQEKQFIDSVSGVLPDIFSAADKEAVVTRLGTDATRVLGRHTAVMVFGMLGMVDSKIVDLTRVSRSPVSDIVVRLANSLTEVPSDEADFAQSSGPGPAARLYFVNSSVDWALAQPKSLDTCNCHAGTIGDFCDTITGPYSYCRSWPCTQSSLYCGWLFLQPCNGKCT
jgi:hypothetical protein